VKKEEKNFAICVDRWCGQCDSLGMEANNKRKIQTGDVVTIRPEWRDEGDEAIRFVAIEDEDGGRVRIEAQMGLTFNPNEVVTTDMLEVQC
jgi:hypothetical protein